MNSMPITLTIAAAAALVNLWLGMRVSLLRRRFKVSIGDGDNEAIRRRMRAHANFVEYTPFFLILLGLIELTQGSADWLWLVSIVYVLGRIAHMFGMDGADRLRSLGIATSWLCMLVLAGYALAIPYLDRAREAPVSYALPDRDEARTS